MGFFFISTLNWKEKLKATDWNIITIWWILMKKDFFFKLFNTNNIRFSMNDIYFAFT